MTDWVFKMNPLLEYRQGQKKQKQKHSWTLIDCNELFSRDVCVKCLIFFINRPTQEWNEVRSLDLHQMNEREEEGSDSGPTLLPPARCRWAGN